MRQTPSLPESWAGATGARTPRMARRGGLESARRPGAACSHGPATPRLAAIPRVATKAFVWRSLVSWTCNVPAATHGGPGGCALAARRSPVGRTGEGPRFGGPRQTGGGQALGGLPPGAGPPADRGRAGSRKDHPGASLGPRGGLPLSPPAIHQRHAAQRRSGRYHLQHPFGGLRVQAGTDFQQFSPGGRDQPHHAQDPVGAAGGHERGPGDHRRALPSAAPAVHGDRHAKPGGASRHLSAARIAARPFPHAPARGLSRPGQRARDPEELRRQPARARRLGPGRRGYPAVAGDRAQHRRGQCPGGLHAGHRGEDAQPRSAGAGREPARVPGAVPRRRRRWPWSKAGITSYRTT